MEQDIRWEQRFSNYVKALRKLSQAVEYIKNKFNNADPIDNNDLNSVMDEIIKEGLIQRFEYTQNIFK